MNIVLKLAKKRLILPFLRWWVQNFNLFHYSTERYMMHELYSRFSIEIPTKRVKLIIWVQKALLLLRL